MTITVAEGEAFAARWLKAQADGFHNGKNNHKQTMQGLVADNMKWSWSDGNQGKGNSSILFDVISNTWGSLVSEWMYEKPFVCVDTDASEVIMMLHLTVNVSGGLPNETNLFQANEAQRIKLNDDMKVTYWKAVWDNNEDPEAQKAIKKVLSKLGKELPPAAAAPFTTNEGEAYANDFLEAFSAGFKKNNHSETIRKFYSSGKMSWEWSDGSKGEGTVDDYMDLLTSTWGPLVDSWLYSTPHIVVDPANALVILGVHAFVNITGGFADENNPVQSKIVMAFHLDRDMKCFKTAGSWDNNETTLKATLQKIQNRIEAESKASQGVGMQAMAQAKLTGQ